MAQADNPKGLRPYKCAPPRPLPVKTTQTFAVGDALELSSGQVCIATAAGAILCGVAAQPCASLTAGVEVMVYADPDDIFIARQDSTDALVIDNEPDLTGATGAMQLDSDASSTDVFKIVGGPLANDDGSAASAAAGRKWLVKINKHAFAQID